MCHVVPKVYGAVGATSAPCPSAFRPGAAYPQTDVLIWLLAERDYFSSFWPRRVPGARASLCARESGEPAT